MKPLRHYRKAMTQHGHPFKFVLGRLLVKSRASLLFTIQCDLYRVRFTPSVYALNYLLRPNVREWPEHGLLLSYLRPGDTVIDVGANQGMMALTASGAVGKTGKVFAIEPHPRTFGWLEKNIAINFKTNIVPKNVAAGASVGSVTFSDDWNDSANHVTSDGPLVVGVETLDRLITDVPEVAMLKIDVEGYEKFVLEGATRTLSRTACVYFEAHDATYAAMGYESADVVSLLFQQGFRVYRWLPGNVFIREIDNTYRTSDIPENLLAIRDIEYFMKRTGNRYTVSCSKDG